MFNKVEEIRVQFLKKFEETEKYRSSVVFPVGTEEEIFPSFIVWSAVVIIFIIGNAPIDKIEEIIKSFLNISSADLYHLVTNVVIPIKTLLFWFAFFVLFLPILRALIRSKARFVQLDIKKLFLLTGSIFLFLVVLLILLILVLQIPIETLFTYKTMGFYYRKMSYNPFKEPSGWYYRRLLMPALANLLHLGIASQVYSDSFYYFFSVVLTLILIFLSLVFLELKTLGIDSNNNNLSSENDLNKTNELPSTSMDQKLKYLAYFSLFTAGFTMINLQWLGYPDQLFFILILIAACVPLTQHGRLGIIALSMITHETSCVTLIPIILFCYPKKERLKGLFLILIYILIFLTSFGFDLVAILNSQTIFVDRPAFLHLIIYPDVLLLGILFAYKFLWIIISYVLWRDWHNEERLLVVALISMLLLPFITLPFAGDTTRMICFGSMGLIISFSIFIKEFKTFPRQKVFLFLLIVNLLIPSIPIVIVLKEVL
ncbi:MAG: hypothetical protein ACFFDI_30070 [Promethearchaeota archaeon]